MNTNQSCMIKVGYPAITEIRIGSAIKIAIAMYRSISGDIVESEISVDRLKDLIREARTAFKYVTVKNYANHVLETLLDDFSEDQKIEEFDGDTYCNICKESGEILVPIEMLTYLNESLFPCIADIAFQNFLMGHNNEYRIKIPFEAYCEIYKKYTNDVKQMAHMFCQDMFAWLNYNQIAKVTEAFILDKLNYLIVFSINVKV